MTERRDGLRRTSPGEGLITQLRIIRNKFANDSDNKSQKDSKALVWGIKIVCSRENAATRKSRIGEILAQGVQNTGRGVAVSGKASLFLPGAERALCAGADNPVHWARIETAIFQRLLQRLAFIK